MYQSEILEKLKDKPRYVKVNQYDPDFFAARGTAAEAEKPKPKKSWLHMPLKTISGSLDYLYKFNAIDSMEAIGGMAVEAITAAEKFVKAPFELHKLVKYKSEVKELNKAKQQGKISDQAYKSRMGTISVDARNLSQKYDPKTAAADALSASLLIPGVGTGGRAAKTAFSFLKREGVKSLVKPTLAKGAGLGLQSTMRETSRALISRPMSTPISQGLIKASAKLAKGKAVVDTVPQITGKDFKPIEIMKEGKLKEAVRFGSAMTTPIPYIGKAFKAMGKTKKYVATATETQAGETAMRKYFGDDIVNMIPNKQAKADILAFNFGMMKERAIPVNAKNIAAHFKAARDPLVRDIPMISNSVKRILESNGIKRTEELKKMTDDMLVKILGDKKDVKALREAIEEAGKTQMTGMAFKTKEEQMKALIVFEYTGVHTGTWKRSEKELRQFINETYNKIKGGGKEILGPEVGIAKTTKVQGFKTPETKALVPYKKPPAPKVAFTMKPNKLKSGSWENNRAALGIPKSKVSTLYSQGVRDLPKGDVSFMAGRKAELGRTLNKMAEGKLGKLLMPQNSREIYHKIRTKLDNSLVGAFGKNTGKAEKAIQKELGEPLVIGHAGFGLKLPIYRPTEREIGRKAWRRIINEATGESVDSSKVKALAAKLNKETTQAFVTSMTEAGIPTNLIDKMRATSGSFNWMFYNLYTLPRFQLRANFWMQQVPEVYQWGHARSSKLVAGSLIRKGVNKQIELKRTINWKGISESQDEVMKAIAIGQTEEISGSGVRAMMFARKNEANAYSLGFMLYVDKVLKNLPKTTKYLKKHGGKLAEDVPYLRKTIYQPLFDNPENLGKLLKKYGTGGGKAHLADPTKTILKSVDNAEWDNCIREAFRIARPNAYKEAIPLFLYNPNRSMLEKSLHAWPMFPLSYAIKIAERGGGYILEGKAIRPKIFASIINTMQSFHENEEVAEMEKKYWNLFNTAEGWLPHDPSYDFSTGFLPPFSKMLWRWAENPEYYVDSEIDLDKRVERSMKVLWPAYREAKGWQQCYDNIKRINQKVSEGGKMTEEEAKKVIEGFRFKEPTKIEKVKLPKLPTKPEKKGKAIDSRTTQEKRFAEKKARRGKLLEVKPEKKKEEEKFVPKITVPKGWKPKTPPTRKKYSK